ncbi:S8 family serine peptidase, partial [Klebsiella pneumoniae]|uniref:S8 family serine peptidase n=1 Tax=Klebsiella pneumoniae TaxID=573 RepID=UPI003851B381
VAVLDQGVTANHPDLPNARQVRLNGSNFIIGENANDPTPNGNDNHGNACAGIIAATQNNNEGISGIAPNVRIMPIKILGGNIDNARIAN